MSAFVLGAINLSRRQFNPASAAPRFSPTRFNPLAAPAGIIPELDCAHALGIKGYTLDAGSVMATLLSRSLADDPAV